MKIYTSTEKQNSFSSVALGYFDGMHKGHQRIISQTVKLKSQGLTPTVFTFNQNPKSAINKTSEDRIMDFETKCAIFSKMGIETTYIIDFKRICNLSAEEFVKNILYEKLNAKYVVCGFNYHFGRGGISDADNLKKLCKKYGIKVKIVSPSLYKNKPISSTRIRKALKDNDDISIKKMTHK